jgi:hypothetical protein
MNTFVINYLVSLGFNLHSIEAHYISFSKRFKTGFTFIKVLLEDDLLISCISLNFDQDFIKSKELISTRSSIDFINICQKIIKFIQCHLDQHSSFNVDMI